MASPFSIYNEEKRRNVKILVIGDVTSPRGIDHLEKNLWKIRKENSIDFCVMNGENASFVTGISPELADVLFKSGADVITGGNHTLRNRAAYTYLDDTREILRPINFGDAAPGHGYVITEARGYRGACYIGARKRAYGAKPRFSVFLYRQDPSRGGGEI